MNHVFSLLPYLEPLLHHHEKAGQQPDNFCGPYWISLLLQSYGGMSLSAVEVAIAAATILPSQGNPADWLPPGARSRLGEGYDLIPTVADPATCGTAITGLIRATEALSRGRFCLMPLQTDDWVAGISALVDLCQTHPDRQIVPLLNVHTGYLWGSHLMPLQLLTYGQTGQLTPPPADWSVGHFALLVGHLQSHKNLLYAILDTYPHFGWHGLHLQPPDTLAKALQRPSLPTQGGVALFVAAAGRSRLIPRLTEAGFQIGSWDNGSPDL